MGFDHDHQAGPRLAAALVNAAHADAASVVAVPAEAVPVEGAPEDAVRTDTAQTSDLEAVLRSHGIRNPALDGAAGRAVAAWSVRLRSVFDAADVEERCAAVNALLAEVSGALYLTSHDGSLPHLHLVPDEQDVVTRVRSVTAGGLAFFVAWSGGQRVGTCARARCARAYVDTSRAGRQRYCTARCGNTDAVARHRQAALPPPGRRR